MISILKKIFVYNWLRKLVSLILAMIIWIVINHSISTTKTIQNVPVKVANIPSGKTVQGLTADGFLDKSVSLCLTGNKHILDQLSALDLTVELDSIRKGNEWIAQITTKNLVCKNPNVNLLNEISHISHPDLIIKLSNLVTEKIPIIVTDPIGNSPKGYRFLDVWPYRLSTLVTGPEEVVKKLKRENLKLTFNLNKISKEELKDLETKGKTRVSFSIPNSWKKIDLPTLSNVAIEIEDYRAKNLRIDFIKQELIPLADYLPISLFFPPQYHETLNPETFSLNHNSFVHKNNGIECLQGPFFAKNVSRLFVEIIQNRINIIAIPVSLTEKNVPLWNVQFIYPHELEDRYVTRAMEENIELESADTAQREEYLRNRFRNYMHQFRLYTENNEKIQLEIKVLANTIDVQPKQNHTVKK